MHGTWSVLVLSCAPVIVSLIVACVLFRFADKDASGLSLLTSVAGVTIAISVVAVMPYDVWQALAGGAGFPDSFLQSTWAATYWTTALLSYLLCPILMEFEASGDFTVAARLRTSIRRNAVFYVSYAVILSCLLVFLIIRGEVQGDVQSWCIAASNAWGLFVLTVLMGFGLVAVPRHFWSLADPSALLQELYVSAVVKDEIRLSRLFELQDTVAQARSELAAHVELEEDSPGLHMQRLAFAKLCQVADRCEMLHRELSGSRIPSPLFGTRTEKAEERHHASAGHGELERTTGNVPLHPPPSLARFAHLHRLLKAAALEARRASRCFDSHVERCIFFEDLQQGDHTAAARLLGMRHLAPAFCPRTRSALARLRRSLLTFWLCHLRGRALLGLGWASCLLSAVVVLGQMTLFADGWHLSMLSLLFRRDYGPWITQAFCLVPLAYVTYTAYFSIFRLKVSGWYGLSPKIWQCKLQCKRKSGSPSGQDRDWCSQINGARSIGVSSTGLSRSGLAANQSVVSSDSGAYQGISVGEYQSKNYLKDLKAFSDSFIAPMNIVCECMNQVDPSLLDALKMTQNQAHELITSAQMVTWKLSATACNSLELLPTLLWAAKGHGDEKDVISPISEVHTSMATTRKDAQTVRTSYIELLNQVRYMGQCTQVTLDQVVILHLPVPCEDESGNLETSPKLAPDPTEHQKISEKCLELALMHLDGLCMLLEDCSDFWLMLHSAELQLRKIEKEAQALCEKLPVDNGQGGGALLQTFCEKVRDFCKECAKGIPNLILIHFSF
ncbi:unnamed protein product [Symbiodinium natans]|uniref:Uncharacterized protein n=1 Tax=Symbiodinium natans TaxID=878477 RepID=A0A812K3R0_9DINO|nr:unnamed protein product [Symbiodinium natans]